MRTLKDVSELEPDDGSIVNQGRSKPGVVFPASAAITRPEPASDSVKWTQPGAE